VNILLDKNIAYGYNSASQKIRVQTEAWFYSEVYCPNCGANIEKYENNRPVADFFCSKCKEEYELKSKNASVGVKIVDGAYRTMMERLGSDNNPSLFLLNYDSFSLQVKNLFVVPKHYFIPEIVEKRKPLAVTAKRAGWIGCNILLQSIPQTGKIYFIKDKQVVPKEKVLAEWQKTMFLRQEKEVKAKGWLLDIMICIDKIGSKDFSLNEVYEFENELRKKHPGNSHIKDKIRQQLQFLRDKRYLEFTTRGNYRSI